MNFDNILQGIKGLFAPKQIVSPVPAEQVMTSGLENKMKFDALRETQARAASNQPTPTPYDLTGAVDDRINKQNNAVSMIRQHRPEFTGDDNIIKKYYDKYGEKLLSNIYESLGNVTKSPQVAPQRVMGASTSPVTTEQIQKGWNSYGDGNAPAATASATFADVANQYPVLKENPGLIPGIIMKESSGGKANTKNWGNWGLYDDSYNETDPNQVIRDMAEAIGGETSPSSHYYKKFRETGDIMDMLERYAPSTENDTGLYHKQLLDWIQMFK